MTDLISIDYRTGYRSACEMLHDIAANPLEVVVYGIPNWKRDTAKNLIAAAEDRIARGVNVSYQHGVIARARQELGA